MALVATMLFMSFPHAPRISHKVLLVVSLQVSFCTNPRITSLKSISFGYEIKASYGAEKFRMSLNGFSLMAYRIPVELRLTTFILRDSCETFSLESTGY